MCRNDIVKLYGLDAQWLGPDLELLKVQVLTLIFSILDHKDGVLSGFGECGTPQNGNLY